jgi:hypothetical protein
VPSAATAETASTSDRCIARLAVLRSPINEFTYVKLVSVPVRNFQTQACDQVPAFPIECWEIERQGGVRYQRRASSLFCSALANDWRPACGLAIDQIGA